MAPREKNVERSVLSFLISLQRHWFIEFWTFSERLPCAVPIYTKCVFVICVELGLTSHCPPTVIKVIWISANTGLVQIWTTGNRNVKDFIPIPLSLQEPVTAFEKHSVCDFLLSYNPFQKTHILVYNGFEYVWRSTKGFMFKNFALAELLSILGS